ncbi:hypothetical protein ABZ763_10955 [Streptomyces bacillaris]
MTRRHCPPRTPPPARFWWEHRVIRHTGDTCWLDIVGIQTDTVVVRAT